MKILKGKNLILLFLYPRFFLHKLTLRAMAIPAGVIILNPMAAAIADFDPTA
jgi:hypothetical protein